MEDAQPIVFVFIHGAGLNSDIWKELPEIEGAASCYADLPRRGRMDARSLSFDDYVDSLVEQINAFERKRIVLVGHSIGGVLMMRLVELLGDRVIGLVGIGAMIPDPGKNFFSCLPFPQNIVMPLIVRFAGTKPPESAIRKSLCADLTAEQSQAVVGMFTAESPALYSAGVAYTPRRLPALFMILTEDKDFPPARQRFMAERLNADVMEVAGGHLAMLSRPQAVSAALCDFAARLP